MSTPSLEKTHNPNDILVILVREPDAGIFIVAVGGVVVAGKIGDPVIRRPSSGRYVVYR